MFDLGKRRASRKGRRRRATGGRRLSMESLEERLALTWAGVPPTSIAVPTSAGAVTLNSQNDASGSSSISTTEVDYYSFTAGSTGSYVISSTTPSSSLDTVLGVFSSTGQRLSYNDDIAYPNTDSRVTISLTAGTRYYVGITNYASSSRGTYSWSIDGPAVTTTPTDDAYENNDTLGAAYNLGTLSATQTVSSLVMADAADWFRFTTTATGTASNTVSISFQNSQGNLQLALYNSAGTLLATSAGTGNTETISLNGRAAGTYYVDVYGNSGATNSNYSLSIVAPTTTTTPPTTGGFQITLSMSGLTASQQTIFQQAAARWAQVITGDLPNATYRGTTVDDLLINASSVSIDGVDGILGQAGPDAFRSGSVLPYHGVMEFDSADMADMERSGLLFSVVLHEMGHILGIGTIWEDKGLLSGAGTSNPTFRGTNATAQYNQIFGTSATGVPVENTGGGGTRDSHWRDSILVNELMTGWAGPGTNLPLSRITVGSLADLGYTVNYAAADSYTPSSSAIASARAASGGGSTSVRFAGLSAAADEITSVTTVATNSQSPVATYPRRLGRLSESYVKQANFDRAYLALDAADSLDASDDSFLFDGCEPDSQESTPADNAWAELAQDWDFWPSFSRA